MSANIGHVDICYKCVIIVKFTWYNTFSDTVLEENLDKFYVKKERWINLTIEIVFKVYKSE